MQVLGLVTLNWPKMDQTLAGSAGTSENSIHGQADWIDLGATSMSDF